MPNWKRGPKQKQRARSTSLFSSGMIPRLAAAEPILVSSVLCVPQSAGAKTKPSTSGTARARVTSRALAMTRLSAEDTTRSRSTRWARPPCRLHPRATAISDASRTTGTTVFWVPR